MTGETEQTLLGLPILNPGEDGIPVDAIVIAKYLDSSDGQTSHRIMFTENLDVVDALGRVRYAQVVLEEGLILVVDDDDD